MEQGRKQFWGVVIEVQTSKSFPNCLQSLKYGSFESKIKSCFHLHFKLPDLWFESHLGNLGVC